MLVEVILTLAYEQCACGLRGDCVQPGLGRACKQLNLSADWHSFALQGGSQAVVANRYHDILPDLKKQHAFEMSMRNASCFDVR